MGGRFKTERAALQQRRIEDSLVQLIGVKPYQDVSVSEICANADLPRRTFYYYFEGKEDVLSSVIQRVFNECDLETMFLTDVRREVMEQSFARFFAYWRDQSRKELCVFVQNGLEQKLTAHCLKWVNSEEQWRRLVENYTQEKLVIGSMLGISCVFYTLFFWCRHGFRQSPEQLAAYVTQILTNPLVETD